MNVDFEFITDNEQVRKMKRKSKYNSLATSTTKTYFGRI